MSTVERDLTDYERRVDDRARYDLALGRQTDDLIDMLRSGDGFMNCNRGEAASRMRDAEELIYAVVDLGLLEVGNDFEREEQERLVGRLKRLAYDEIVEMCREHARRVIERGGEEAA
ncbi:hypothetical protein [Salinicola lusitanus]|uniref:hypothetical protein n=1 Tax=Salinicola lusitanus TaxID=1949085 RepID=UPI000DA1863C|nr:hypothetical protein [Salinicola lusitanus]